MFSKKQRLRTSEYDEVFNLGKTIKTKFFLLKYKKNTLLFPRFAVVIPKKQSKLSVKRHLYKRMFINFLKKTELVGKSFDSVFIFNKQAFDLKEKEFILIINDLELE